VADNESDTQDYSHWRFDQRAPIRDAADASRVYRTVNVDIRLRLAIAAVVPLAVDTPFGDRTARPRPLLVPLNIDGRGSFILDLREIISANSDRQLTAQLLDTGDAVEAGLSEFVVIGEEPFSIAKFRSTALGNRGAQDNTFVAAYDSDTRSWQL